MCKRVSSVPGWYMHHHFQKFRISEVMTQEGNRSREDRCSKVYAVYECLNDDCKHQWPSYHGWKAISTSYSEPCGTCYGNATVIDATAGMTTLDTYVCLSCDTRWQLISPSLGISLCPGCNVQANRSGIQERHATRVTFICRMKKCHPKEAWTSPYFSKVFSQRCRKCQNKGQFMRKKIKEVSDSGDNQTRQGHGGGQHDIEGCDMCQELKKIGQNCLGKVRVHYREVQLEDGRVQSSFTFVVNGRGPRPPPRPSRGRRSSSSGGTAAPGPSGGGSEPSNRTTVPGSSGAGPGPPGAGPGQSGAGPGPSGAGPGQSGAGPGPSGGGPRPSGGGPGSSHAKAGPSLLGAFPQRPSLLGAFPQRPRLPSADAPPLSCLYIQSDPTRSSRSNTHADVSKPQQTIDGGQLVVEQKKQVRQSKPLDKSMQISHASIREQLAQFQQPTLLTKIEMNAMKSIPSLMSLGMYRNDPKV